eukprot:tig00020875_g14897.t1
MLPFRPVVTSADSLSSSLSIPTIPRTVARSSLQRHFSLPAEAIPEDSAVILKRGLRPDEMVRLGTDEGDPYTLDLCFVFDGTGSMASYIAAAKKSIFEIVSVYRKSFPKYMLRLGYVAYRDFGDKKPVETFDFTESEEAFVQSLGAVAATGGADETEDVLGGLEAALKLNWSGRRRVLVHIADAPSHGTFYHDGAGDSHPDFDKDGAKGQSVMRRLAAKSVDFHFCKINESTDKMVRKLAEAYDPAARKPLASLELRSAVNELGALILDTICSTVTASSLSLRTGKGSALEFDMTEYTINKTPVPWDVADHPRWGPWQTVYLYDFPELRSRREPLGYFEIEGEALVHLNVREGVRLRLSQEPCAKGSTRRVYFAMTSKGERLVAKLWNVRASAELTHDLNVGAARCLAVARFFAKRFNPALKDLGRSERVEFVDTLVCNATVGAAAGSARTWMTLEPYMEGPFKKYNSNDGFVLHGSSAESSVLQAFSHYTAYHSRGRLLVVDLQGTGLARLTDPAVQYNAGADAPTGRFPLTRTTAFNHFRIGGLGPGQGQETVPYFSATDLGATGFAKFFETHKCGPLCRALGISRLSPLSR